VEPDIEIWINRAEASCLDILYSHAALLFKNTPLPSHDHSHHMRVWNISKKLLRELASLKSPLDYTLVEGVLIAVFFHDLGMIYSSREDHGKLGSDLCETWFNAGDLKKPERFLEILRAIELHDRKDVQLYNSFCQEAPPEILGILSVSDDLEAMGTIGIYRYAEIYLERGIPLEELGERILANAKSRFAHLSSACKLCQSILIEYSRQFEELCLFFELYQAQIARTTEPEKVYSGQVGVINYIRIRNFEQAIREEDNRIVCDYFKKLDHELDQKRL
jgi:HD superfamily phosphodiesterase